MTVFTQRDNPGHQNIFITYKIDLQPTMPSFFGVCNNQAFRQKDPTKIQQRMLLMNIWPFPALSWRLEEANTKEMHEIWICGGLGVFASVYYIFASVLQGMLVELMCQPIAIRIPKLRQKTRISWTCENDWTILNICCSYSKHGVYSFWQNYSVNNKTTPKSGRWRVQGSSKGPQNE